MRRCLQCDARFGAAGWVCARCGYQPTRDRFPRFTDEARSIDYAVDAYDEDRWAAFEAANAFWYRPRARLIAALIAQHFDEPERLLEVGCGAGGVLEALAATFPATELTGGEPAAEALAIASRRVSGAELLVLDATHLPFRDEFDVVGAFDVIEHLADDRAAIREMAAAVKPGGGLLITVPQHPRLWSRYDEAGGHHRRYTRQELTEKLEVEGLTVERVTSFVTSLLPAVAWSRWRANRAQNYDVVEFDSSPKPAAGVLEWMLDREVDLITRGVSLPAGSSLVAVARR